MIHFVGAGPGAPDLITLRGAKLLEEADLIIYAGSLVNPELLSRKKESARVMDSSVMTLPEVIQAMEEEEKKRGMTVRLHTGDPSIYGAIKEQMEELDKRGISYEVTPGVSSFCAAAASLGLEYTLPDISQSVVITRMAGRTLVPERESVASFASHRATMVLFLSAGMAGKVSEELIRGGYREDTPAAIIYQASWADEQKAFCTVGTLEETAAGLKIKKHALIIVGDAVKPSHVTPSRLYAPEFTTEFRKGKE